MDDEQPRIAILGAGPIGLEAALYARYLGYPVEILERSGKPAADVLAKDTEVIGHFGELASTLGVSALKAQNPDWQALAASTKLSSAEWHDTYLMPLADSDLIADVLHLNTEVVTIERRDDEEDVSFQIRCRDEQGTESVYEADIVIDATGIAGNRSWFSAQDADGEWSFLNPEADYYILGGKTRRDGQITFGEGLAQIRELFAILGERDDLDVYATMPPLA
ncbi:MAG: NAD-binding protein [Bythopirellula sp.]|nr:NAD-binding protein [Bythopirellula sp.]